jgi:peptidoglycan/LPS O-acetylase OafA/YrhL
MHLTKSNLSNHLDPFLALRGLACLVVIFYHVAPPRNFIVYKNYDFSWILFGHGYVAVLVFFCLSGYLMGKAFYSGRYTLNKKGIFIFFRNRFLRIFPLYYFSVLILAVFVYTPILQINNWGYLLRLCTFTFNQSLTVNFSGSFWSLSTEVQFYLIVPLIYAVLKNRLQRKRQVIVVFGLILLLDFLLRITLTFIFQTQGNYHNYIRYIYTPLLTNIDVFMCGFLVNALLRCKTNIDSEPNQEVERKSSFFSLSIKFKKILAFILVVILFLSTSYYHYYHKPGESLVYPVVTAIITSFFIWLFESGNSNESLEKNEKLSFNAIVRNPARILEVAGILSYGVYLWHQGILAKITTIITSTNPVEVFFLQLVGTLVLSSVLATVTYYAVELPAARWKIYRICAKTSNSTVDLHKSEV